MDSIPTRRPNAPSGAGPRGASGAPQTRALIRLTTLALTVLALPLRLHAQPTASEVTADSAPRLTIGGFVDGYVAWVTGAPPTRDRAFAGGAAFGTQPARHNEFNINLAFLEAAVEAPRHRGRLAVQFGTSVQANYAGEPTQGDISGPGVQQFLQEAWAGVRLGERTWVDGGIFYSNMGMESWVSRDNPTYTRSLVADYSPYYSTGVRLTHELSPTLTARLDVVNGWQNISENNDGKGIGARLDWSRSDATTLSYYTFVSEEAGTRTRLFNGVGATHDVGPVTLLGQADLGVQRRTTGEDGWSRWYGLLAIARAQVAPRIAMVGRVERYDDPDQVILGTGARVTSAGPVANDAFRGNGASLGLDVQLTPAAVWRVEARGFAAGARVFPNGTNAVPSTRSGFVVSSLAVTF